MSKLGCHGGFIVLTLVEGEARQCIKKAKFLFMNWKSSMKMDYPTLDFQTRMCKLDF